jgi:hypothetical protein
VIDLIAEYFKYEKQIYEYIQGRKEAYFNSDCYTRLKRRCERLKDSYNLRIGNGNWKSKIVLPILKEQMRITRAMTLQYFRSDPPISLEPILDTPHENSINMQLVLNMNLKATEWRQRVWRPLVQSASILGTAVQYGYYYESDYVVKRTVQDAFGQNVRVPVNKTMQQVRHENIDILNYFQNPTAIDPYNSEFQGHIDTVLLSELADNYQNNSDKYIQGNLEKVMKRLRDSGPSRDSRLQVDNIKDRDENRMGDDRSRWWGTINIKGNEDDNTIYYVEWIGDVIIRFQADVYDCDLKPYSIFNYEKRFDYWWGNPNAEDLLPHENYLNLLLSIRADKELQSNQRLRLFQKGQLDIADINNRAINDGFVPVDLMQGQRIDQVVWEMQHQPDSSLQTNDWITREMKESMQRMSNKVDLQRGQQQGGLANKTLGAAQIIQQQSDMMSGDFLDSFGDGLVRQGKFDVVVLQQMLDGEIMVRPDIKQVSKVLRKPEILGDFDQVVKTSLQTNNLLEGQRLMNIITQLINFKGTGLPEFQALNVVKAARAWIRQQDLGEDIDDILPETAGQGQQGYQQSAPPQQAQQAQAKGRAMVGPQPQGALSAAA